MPVMLIWFCAVLQKKQADRQADRRADGKGPYGPPHAARTAPGATCSGADVSFCQGASVHLCAPRKDTERANWASSYRGRVVVKQCSRLKLRRVSADVCVCVPFITDGRIGHLIFVQFIFCVQLLRAYLEGLKMHGGLSPLEVDRMLWKDGR